MIDVTERSSWRFPLFFILYFIQGVVIIAVMTIIPLYFVEKAVSLPLTTLVVGIAMLPWSFKFFWGGFVDYFIQRGRRLFIILGALLLLSGLIAVSFIDPSSCLVLFVIFLFLSVCGVVIFDVAIDALAIEVSMPEERGKISGSMLSGQNTGKAFGSIFLTVVAQLLGFHYSFFFAGLLVLFTLPLPLFFKEPLHQQTPEPITSVLFKEFKKKKTQFVSIFALVLQISYGLLVVVIPLYLRVSLQLEVVQIGIIIALFQVASAVGSLVGGSLADKIGRKIVTFTCMGFSLLLIPLFIVALSWETVAFLYSMIGFLNACFFAVILALYMDITNPRVGATQFSILASLSNGGMIFGNTISGSLIALLGFARVFLFTAWFLGPPLLLAYFLGFHVVQKKDRGSKLNHTSIKTN
jgi:PAT family beta-lactamase induction signal transducer AmpG